MTRITDDFQMSNVKDLDELKRFIDAYVKDATQVVNGKLEFNTNLLTTAPTKVVFSTVNVDTPISHTLKKTPQGFFVTGSLAACKVYNGVTANTSSTMYLKSDTATTVYVVIF